MSIRINPVYFARFVRSRMNNSGAKMIYEVVRQFLLPGLVILMLTPPILSIFPNNGSLENSINTELIEDTEERNSEPDPETDVETALAEPEIFKSYLPNYNTAISMLRSLSIPDPAFIGRRPPPPKV